MEKLFWFKAFALMKLGILVLICFVVGVWVCSLIFDDPVEGSDNKNRRDEL